MGASMGCGDGGHLMRPVPTLDHVVVNVRDRMDEAAAQYGRLGFQLTPRGFHTLGSMNHLAIFGTDYLELIAAPAGSARRTDILDWPEGLNGLVFGTENSAGVYAALTEAGVPAQPPVEFSRPVDIPDGARDAVFRTVRLPHDTTPAGRLYFCHHFTRDLVWRDEWRVHPNGALGVMAAVIAANDPLHLGGLFARMFGDAAVSTVAGGVRLAVGLSSFDVLNPADVAARFGVAAPDTRPERMAALVLRCTSLDQAQAALLAGGIAGVVRDDARVLVPAAEAFGTAIEFRV